eukprot:4179793-Ditylum_brightwellii.AAC.1
MGCKKYITEAVSCVEQTFGCLTKHDTLMVAGDHPELDDTKEHYLDVKEEIDSKASSDVPVQEIGCSGDLYIWSQIHGYENCSGGSDGFMLHVVLFGCSDFQTYMHFG